MQDRSTGTRAAVALVVAALVALGLVGAAPPPPAAAATSTPVMAQARVTSQDLADFFRSKGKVSEATVSIDALAWYYISEGAAEGVAGDLAFVQSIVETGWFSFSSRTPPEFNNFSGLGAVDGGTGAASFPDARTGVRAQIQHLRAYADPTVTTAKLANPLVDPRFSYVAPKGKAPTWEQFGNGIWASAANYSDVILRIYGELLDFVGDPVPPPPPPAFTPFASADALVVQAHRDLLSREATAAERTSGAADLEARLVSPVRYLADLVEGEGAEHGQPVVRLYLAGLGRLPDGGGLDYWTRRHLDGVRIVRLADQFLGSSEFARRYGNPSDADFVDLLYVNVLGRVSDVAGADYWTRRLQAGAIDRAGLLVQFSESPEHVRSRQATTEATIVYFGMVRRAPDSSVLTWWAGKRDAGYPLETLTDLVWTSSAYQARFS